MCKNSRKCAKGIILSAHVLVEYQEKSITYGNFHLGHQRHEKNGIAGFNIRTFIALPYNRKSLPFILLIDTSINVKFSKVSDIPRAPV